MQKETIEMKYQNDVYKFFPELNKEDDIGQQLNQLYYSKILNGHYIYIWGIGNTTKSLLKEIPNLNIKAFIDNNITKSHIWYNNKEIPVIAPSHIENDTYIIISSIYYEDIYAQLKKMGKIEYLNFISWRYLLPTPKSMFLTIINTPPITNWKCIEAMRMKRLQADGSCSFCACPAWTTQSVVNIFLDQETPIEKNIKARLFFYSIFSGRYTYCKKQVCPGLMHNLNNFQSNNIKWKDLEKKANQIAKVIMPDFDHTCNLYCRKCRTQPIYENKAIFDHLTNYFITHWMPYSDLTKLAGNGEVMASKYYRKILKYIGTQKGTVIYSNGLLLNKSVVSNISKEAKGNCFFIISIDAAQEDTYCKLQCGGNFNVLMENLKEISKFSNPKKIKGFMLAFVISKQNEAEIDDFVYLMRTLGANAITFLPLKNFGTYSPEEFEELSLFTEDNKPKTQSIKDKLGVSQ